MSDIQEKTKTNNSQEIVNNACKELGINQSELAEMMNILPNNLAQLKSQDKIVGAIRKTIELLIERKNAWEAKSENEKPIESQSEEEVANTDESDANDVQETAQETNEDEIVKNSVEIKESKDEQIESLEDGQIHYMAKFEEIVATLKELGISTKTINDNKDVINLSNFLGKFERLISELSGRCEGVKISYKDDKDLANLINPILEKIEELKKFFGVIMNYFLNPPSKELLELSNRSIIINKIFTDFDDFIKRSQNFSLASGLTEKQKLLTEHLNLIDDFVKKFDGKIENIHKRYDDFGKGVITKQEENIKQMESRLNGYIENSDNTVIKISKALKYIKGGIYGLISLTAVFCVVSGIMVGLTFWKYHEFENLQTLVSQFGNVGVERKSGFVVLSFPLDSKYSETKDSKQIWLLAK